LIETKRDPASLQLCRGHALHLAGIDHRVDRVAGHQVDEDEIEHRDAQEHRDQDEETAAETLDFLRSYGLAYVVVDMPQGHASSVPPVVAATTPDLAVVRFHGHSDKWTSRDIYERFGYHYSADELAPWASSVRELAGTTAETHVLFNNCYRDYAQTNAREFADLVAAPDA